MVVVHEVGKPRYEPLLPLPDGDVLIGVFSMDRDGLIGIQFDRGYTERLSVEESARLIEAFRMYLAAERAREN